MKQGKAACSEDLASRLAGSLLATRGYSWNHRSECPQVVLALVVTREGFPLAHYPKARPFVDISLSDSPMSVARTWNVAKFKAALACDGAYLLQSNQAGWSAGEFWETYSQFSVVADAVQRPATATYTNAVDASARCRPRPLDDRATLPKAW